ncbi:MAG TPA: cation:proton antiporter [Flavobacteriales bacterium]
MDAYNVLTFLSGLIIFSYLFDLFAKRTRVPSVLLLLATGMVLRALADHWNFRLFDVQRILPALGNVGLILIVFEGALDLTYTRSKRPLIRKAFVSSLCLLLLTTAGIAGILFWHTSAPLLACVTNAVPLSVVSSAVAIPSARGLAEHEREFVVYESSFSDILGIILFNFLVSNDTFGVAAFGHLALEIVWVLVLSAVFSIALLWLLGRITHHVKFFLILAILILVYAVGKQFHLSSLVVILAFGMFLANAGQVPFTWFRERFLHPAFQKDLEQFHSLSNESAFLIRTFFFVLFGFSVVARDLIDAEAAILCGLILAGIYLLRPLFIGLAVNLRSIPVMFITPRGLISILLFFSIPASLRIEAVNTPLLFLVVLSTCLIMALGLIVSGKSLPLSEHGPDSLAPAPAEKGPVV